MKKHLVYLYYLLLHKLYVFIECCKLGIPFRGLIHDWSKFTPGEWFPYVRYYNCKRTDKIQRDFNKAWNQHQKRNKHHYQYWVLIQNAGSSVALEMPDKYRKEMLADWRGAGHAKKKMRTDKTSYSEDECKTWYLKNKNKMTLHKKTRAWVEKELGV